LGRGGNLLRYEYLCNFMKDSYGIKKLYGGWRKRVWGWRKNLSLHNGIKDLFYIMTYYMDYKFENSHDILM